MGYQRRTIAPRALSSWYRDDATGLTLNEARSHMASDLHRYLFAASYADVVGRSPMMRDFPVELRPKHRNVSEAVEGKKFGDRFHVQSPDRPSSTVTSHISKDGHYFIHYSPEQCRSLTVREAARLQTFPDNYLFCGNRTEQYHQVGNAVPPLLAILVAQSVFNVVAAAGSRR
jgi:DNA (cytosine-5)-methyltransferase 1